MDWWEESLFWLQKMGFLPKTSKTSNGHARPIFWQHPPNLVGMYFSLSCKNVKIFVMIYQALVNISVSVLSTS